MFESDKSKAQISVDSTSKPFWTTGDAITGSIRLQITQKQSLDSVQIKLICEEVGKIAADKEAREKHTPRKQRRIHRVEKRIIEHYNYALAVLDAQAQLGAVLSTSDAQDKTTTSSASSKSATGSSKAQLSLEPGEYVFPFTIDLDEEIDACPPHAPVRTRGGLDVGVNWYLKVVVRKSSLWQRNIRTKRVVPVFPRSPNLLSKSWVAAGSGPRFAELSGGKPLILKGNKLTSIFKPASRECLARLAVTLKYPARGLSPRPKPGLWQLFAKLEGLDKSEGTTVQLHGININLKQSCLCAVGRDTDTYVTRTNLASVTVMRPLTERVLDLSDLLQGVALPEVCAPAFQGKVVKISHDLELTIEYSLGIDPKLQHLVLSTPTDVVPPFLDWVGPNLPLMRSQRVTFSNDVRPDYETGPSSSGARSTTTGTTGTTGATYPSFATVNSYEVQGPMQMVSSWLSKW